MDDLNELDLNDLQFAIMVFIKQWADTQKTTIPQKEIIKNLRTYGVESYTILFAIKTLIDKGYIRKAYSQQQNRSFYVMIRNIEIKTDYCFKWIPNKKPGKNHQFA